MDLPFPAEDLARLYRFALLMTGEEGAAQQVLHDACQGCAARVGGYRNDLSTFACLLGSIRTLAKSVPAADANSATREVPPLVRAFAVLPEPERAALGMLYTGLLPAKEISEVLKMPLERLGPLLKSARERLWKSGVPMDGEPETEVAR